MCYVHLHFCYALQIFAWYIVWNYDGIDIILRLTYFVIYHTRIHHFTCLHSTDWSHSLVHDVIMVILMAIYLILKVQYMQSILIKIHVTYGHYAACLLLQYLWPHGVRVISAGSFLHSAQTSDKARTTTYQKEMCKVNNLARSHDSAVPNTGLH